MNGINRTSQSQHVTTLANQNQVDSETFDQRVSRIFKAMPASSTQFSFANNLLLGEVIKHKESFIRAADQGNHLAFMILDKFMECSSQLVADTGGRVPEFVEAHRALFNYVSQQDQSFSPTATFLHSKFYADGVLFERDERLMFAFLIKTVALGWDQSKDVAPPAKYIAHKAAYYLHTIYKDQINQQSDPEQASLCKMQSEYWLLVKNTIKSSSMNGNS